MDDVLLRELRDPPPMDENVWREIMARAAKEIANMRSLLGAVSAGPDLGTIKHDIARSGDVPVQISTVK